MNAQKSIIPAFCFAAGAAVTWVICKPRMANGSAVPPARQAVAPTVRTANMTLANRIHSDKSPEPSGNRLAGDLPRITADWKPGENTIRIRVDLLQTLAKSRGSRRLDQSLLEESDPIEAALGLTDDEKTRIRVRWEALLGELRAVEAGVLKTEDLEDGSVRLRLPDLSRERGRLASGFKDNLESTLGRDRAVAFSALKQLEGVLSENSGERSVTIKVESVGQNQWSYRMTLEDGAGKRVWVGGNIPDELRHLADAAGIYPTVAEAMAGQ